MQRKLQAIHSQINEATAVRMARLYLSGALQDSDRIDMVGLHEGYGCGAASADERQLAHLPNGNEAPV
jgi:hypothetical protein